MAWLLPKVRAYFPGFFFFKLLKKKGGKINHKEYFSSMKDLLMCRWPE